jgi:hypothetical protein
LNRIYIEQLDRSLKKKKERKKKTAELIYILFQLLITEYKAFEYFNFLFTSVNGAARQPYQMKSKNPYSLRGLLKTSAIMQQQLVLESA